MCHLRCHRCLSTESRSDTWHLMSSYWVTVMSSSLSYAVDWAGLGKVWTILRCLMWREVFHRLTRLTWLQRNVQKSLRLKYQELVKVMGWDASDCISLLTVVTMSKVKTIHQTICWHLKNLTTDPLFKNIFSISDSTKWRRKFVTRYWEYKWRCQSRISLAP